MRRLGRARRHCLPRDPPRRPRGGGRRRQALGFDLGAHHDPAVRGKDAHRSLLRLLRAAHRFPAHARALPGGQPEARGAHYPALPDRRSAAGFRGPGIGQERPRRDRIPGMTARMAARILVVDDQRANAEMMAEVLRARGYEVLTAPSGEAALAQVGAVRPDILVSDILMPGMDGYEICRRLRDDAATALLPIILVTSLDAQAERVKGLEAGADDFLSKPVNWEELFARVQSLLRVKALQDELKQLNQQLEERVSDQVAQLERLGRMKRFFSRP